MTGHGQQAYSTCQLRHHRLYIRAGELCRNLDIADIMQHHKYAGCPQHLAAYGGERQSREAATHVCEQQLLRAVLSAEQRAATGCLATQAC